MAAVVRNSRSSILLLAVLLGAVAWSGRGWFRAPGVTASEKAPNAVALRSMDRVVNFETIAEADAEPVGVSGKRPAAELSADEAVRFTTLCDLHLLAGETELDLTTKQWSRLAEIVVQTQAVRHHYEATIAVATETAPGRYRLEIPAYAAAGDELRRRFLADLEAGLGQEAAAEVTEKLGRQLEGRFAGFGVGTQTLDITGDPVVKPADVQVARTARYWNSVEGNDRVTTRREVTFPASEDPTGENWNALLALVGKAD